MFCSKCGNQLVQNTGFCNNCGEPVPNTNNMQVDMNQNNNSNPQVNTNPQGIENSYQMSNQQYQNQPSQWSNNQNNNSNPQVNPNPQGIDNSYQMSNQQFQNQPSQWSNNQNYNQPNPNYATNEVPNSSKGFVGTLSLIFGITGIVFLFINEYVGLLLGIIAVVTSIKIKSSHSKKGKITGIIAIVICTLYIIGTISLNLLGYTTNDKSLKGDWNCTNINNLVNEEYTDTMSFNNGKYTFVLDGVTTSSRYIVSPSTYNKEAWESMKNILQIFFEVVGEPETFVLASGDEDINIIKINTTDGELLLVYHTDTHVCKR
jgi:Uncharacterized conserved protein